MPRRGRRDREVKEQNGANPCKLPRLSDVKSPLDFSSPERLFESLISPMKSDDFFCEYWENKPMLLQRGDSEISAYYQTLFQLSDMKHIAGRGIYYERDINLFKYKNGKKVSLPRHGKATYLHLLKDFGSGKATMQLHQPQRFSDGLWHIMEKLECFFGALVGSNVYITPPDSQGLPAHYDDVEVFILQLEGEKRWRLYTPTVPLATDYSGVPEDEIGPPTHDFILKPGDLLYFPRGVIHHAHTLAGSTHSTHVTISTYQNNTWTDYLQDMLPGFLHDSVREDIELRRGIPRQLMMTVDKSIAVKQLCTLLTSLAKRLESTEHLRSLEMVRDFMGSRLPPFRDGNSSIQPTTQENGAERKLDVLPKLESTVQLQHRDYALFTVDHISNGLNNKSDLVVYVYHSLKNDRETHMMGVQEQACPVNGLRFPLSHINALKQIWSCEPVCVKDLPLEQDEDKENFALSLWTEGLLAVVPREA
ncbi:ribosomal oxygenase 2 [Rhinophrynus dorsalis]